MKLCVGFVLFFVLFYFSNFLQCSCIYNQKMNLIWCHCVYFKYGVSDFFFLFELVLQLCLTLSNPMGCSPPGSSVRGILQARILERVDIPFSRGSSRPRGQTWISCIAGRFFASEASGHPNNPTRSQTDKTESDQIKQGYTFVIYFCDALLFSKYHHKH